MMMKNKIKYLSALMLSLTMFTGCQLALEGKAGDSVRGDRFVGVFITRGSSIGSKVYKDSEIEEMTEEELASLKPDSGDEKYYATFKEEDKTFDFKQEGYSFFSVEIRENEESTYTALLGEVISDSSSHFSVGVDEEKTELEGTIRYSPGLGEVVWYLNPVYQEDDGDVYALPSGPGISSDDRVEEGSVLSQWQEEVTTVTENGQSKSVRTSVKVNFEKMFRPEMIAVFEMDENSQIVSEKEYEPGELPETYIPQSDTTFIIIETHKKGADGTAVTREIFDHTNESLETFYAREDGIITVNHSILEWTK